MDKAISDGTEFVQNRFPINAIGYGQGMKPALKSLAIWFAIEFVLPCLYFAITGGCDAAVAAATVLLVVYAISAPFCVLSWPLWRMATKLSNEQAAEKQQD